MNTQLFKKALSLSLSRVILTSLSARKIWLRAFVLVVIVLIAGPAKVAAYDVCSDPGSPCTHEVMTGYGLDFFLDKVRQELQYAGIHHPYAKDIDDHWWAIEEGAGIPDQYDPLYGNYGADGMFVTITHFWDADSCFGAPMDVLLDDYPNALNVAQALWTRALGAYAARNKGDAYRFLGMITHFLGDMTVPAHVKNDMHGPGNRDAFEKWMCKPAEGGGDSPNVILTPAEIEVLIGPQIQMPAILAETETENRFLWLFLNTNQVADYFASDGDEGDPNWPSDPYYSYVNDWLGESLALVKLACEDEPGGCPTNTDHLDDNEGGYYYLDDNSDLKYLPENNDEDGDLSLIRKYSYLPGIYAIGALLYLWDDAISRPILTVNVHKITEGSGGIDPGGTPDYFVGMVMGYNERFCSNPDNCPDPVGAYLFNRGCAIRGIDSTPFPSNVTRADAFKGVADGGTENQSVVWPNYHFGQSYNYARGASEYVAGMDIVDISLSVWDQDELDSPLFDHPYVGDDIADIHPADAYTTLSIKVDLAKCLSHDDDAVEIRGIVEKFRCAPSASPTEEYLIEMSGNGDDDATVFFSVAMVQPDSSPPVITCDAPDGVWHGADVSISCTAADAGSGLANPADDAAFLLWTDVPLETETGNAATDTKEVCDAAGNCATAGPVSGNMVDKKAPEITIVQPVTAQYVHSATLELDYTVTDDGSEVLTVTPTMNGSPTVAGKDLSSGRVINLLTSLPLGANTFTVNAVDNVGNNASPPASVTFTIIVTPQSMIDAVNQFQASGAIGRKAVRPLLAKLRNAMAKQSKGQCGPAGNMYGAFINQVQGQSGKSITLAAAGILIADALYLIAHCP